MKVIIDTQEKSNFHILKYLNENNIEWVARKMAYCDYSFEAEINGEVVNFENIIAIERKANLTELSGNLCRGRLRFEKEFSKGKTEGCKMVLLIEDAHAKDKMKLRKLWDKAGIDMDTKQRKTWRTGMTGTSMIASIDAFRRRYDLDLVFCRKADAGKEMIKIFQEYLEVQDD